MFTFYNQKENYFISTNTKVLSSTLRNMPGLFKANRLNELINNCKLRFTSRASPHYLLVRNPYDRVESFFKEKLRSKVKQATKKIQPYQLKLHQELFYPFAGITSSDSLVDKQEKLLQFSWDQFIQSLPYVYLKDVHLRPQSTILLPKLRGVLPFPMKYSHVFKIDEELHIKDIERLLKLDMSVKLNATTESPEIIWDEKAIEIVNRIYSEDFRNFNYTKQSVN